MSFALAKTQPAYALHRARSRRGRERWPRAIRPGVETIVNVFFYYGACMIFFGAADGVQGGAGVSLLLERA